MKKIYLSLFAVAGFCFAMVAQTSSNLVVFSEDASLFYLYINGINQNLEPKSNVKITGLTSPNNQVMIVFSDNRKGSLKKNLFFQEMGVEATAKITFTKKGYKLRYFGEVPIANGSTMPGQWVSTYSPTEIVASGTPNGTGNATPTPTGSGQTSGSTSGTVQSGSTSGTTGTVNTGSTSTGNNTLSASGTTNTQGSTPVQTASAVDMAYVWKPGTAHTFSVNQVDDVSTSMMGMSMKDKFTTTTEFILYIASVAPNGTASGWLYLIDYKVMDTRNTVLASLNDLPRQAIQSEVQVDRKGHFTFPHKLQLITTANGNVLAYVKPDGNGVAMGGQAGDLQVDAYAEFDPKTGQLKAGYKATEIKSTRKVNVKMTEETDLIDVLPYDYLELLALPDGAVAQGDQAVMRAGMYTTTVLVSSMANGSARLNYKLLTDKSKDPASSDMKATDGQGNTMMNMNTDQMGMPNMGSVDPQSAGMMQAMSPTMTADVNSDFSVTNGMFNMVSGVVTTSMNAMGLQMNVVSNLTMRKL